MLYKFKSKETADLIMLEPNALQIFSLIGKEPTAKGIVLLDEMPLAIQKLQEAVLAEGVAATKTKQAMLEKIASKDDHDFQPWTEVSSQNISLQQRVTPFVEMLKRAHAAKVEVVWGV